MNPYEKMVEGMRLMHEACAALDTCDDCPFKWFCNDHNSPIDWAIAQAELEQEDEDPDYDCDWGYNEDMGFDAYLGCYTDDC